MISMSCVDKKKPVPLYLQCAEVLASRIRQKNYSVGYFIPSERDLSREFKVARLTVRKSLSELVRRGLLESVPGAGNRVVTAEKSVDHLLVIRCVIVRNVRPVSLSPFYADIFSGIEQETARSGCQLVFSAFEKKELWDANGKARAADVRTRAARMLKEGGFNGIIFIDGVPDEFVLAIQKSGVPVVLADKSMAYPGVSSVVPDNISGARDAARYLLDLGHRRIAFLAAPQDPVVEARYKGFLKAHEEAGVRFDSKLFIRGGYEIGPAHAAMKEFLARRRKQDLPTAVFAINDEAAIGVMKALQAHGVKVPDNVSVIGFDDIAWASHTEPPLTTIRIQREEMGRLAANLLIRQIEAGPGKAPATKLLMQTELVVRESCAKAR
jgi:DNA-binding LacI/PurR family transcriptional regulator